jgi:hypothetical protein
MLAGLFSKSGYHMGENLYPGRDTNPKGFFESGEINGLNEDIIKFNSKHSLKSYILGKDYNQKLNKNQGWLASFERNKKFFTNRNIIERIKMETSKVPFCFKDPRFSYTYPLWKPFADNHVCLIIFRHPAKTIESMIKEIKSQKYLTSYNIDIDELNRMWINQYESCLRMADDQFMFLHYDQVFKQKKLDEIKEKTNCHSLENFQDLNLNRSQGDNSLISEHAMGVYQKLTLKSDYHD